LADLIEVLEHAGVKRLLAIGRVEALDAGVLVELARLDVARLDPVALAAGSSTCGLPAKRGALRNRRKER